MKQLAIGVLACVLAPLHASAEFCDQFLPIVTALEARDASALPDPLVLGQGEAECYFEVTPESGSAFAPPAGLLEFVACDFINSEAQIFGTAELEKMASELSACPGVVPAGNEDYEDGAEYFFDFGETTALFLGNDGDGIYFEMENP